MVTGFKRYFKLFQNVSNPLAYWKDKFNPGQEIIFYTKPNKIKLSVPKRLMVVFKEIFLSDVYDINSLKNELNEESTVIDIGANVGFFPFLLLSKCRVKKILAFEPVPGNLKIFKLTMTENTSVADRIQLVQGAVTGLDQNGVDLFLSGSDDLTENASIFSNPDSSGMVKISCPSFSLTKILRDNQIDTVDFLKMDCEGSEFDIVYNTDPALFKKVKKMIVEVHEMKNDQRNTLNYFNNYLTGLGFKTSSEMLSTGYYMLVAKR